MPLNEIKISVEKHVLYSGRTCSPTLCLRNPSYLTRASGPDDSVSDCEPIDFR